ncbi:MAG: hypothetical protein HKP61_15905 [Dactylosporangium sp.]|nr:hypothetical protein [Dactylosporangium sp.]NNJ62390.1 hypothetical protein [Dactylosporangium sp.]
MQALGTIMPVLGAHPQAGASGVALALADMAVTAGLRVRLLDCADPGRSGLAGVCQIEGRSVSGGEHRAAIRCATRNLPQGVLPVRRLVGTGAPMPVSLVPGPEAWAATDPEPSDITVVDLGWDIWQLMQPSARIGPLTWCRLPLAPTWPVFVVRGTAASAALAEGILARYALGVRHLGLAALRGLAVVGGESWPVQAQAVMGGLLRQASAMGEFVPLDAEVIRSGWGTAPVPAAVLRAVAALLSRIDGHVAQAVDARKPAARRRRFGRS